MTKLKLAASNEVQIEKGVPVPGAISKNGKMWPFHVMEVGDSFSVDPERVPALRSAITYEKSKHPSAKYTVRTLPTGIRCWRLA